MAQPEDRQGLERLIAALQSVPQSWHTVAFAPVERTCYNSTKYCISVL
jgi:alanyl-tRNA synthetase